VWGYGILGVGPKVASAEEPVQIPNTLFGHNEFSPGVHVTSVCCGVHTLAAINNQGELFVWGKNRVTSFVWQKSV
jgi:alpha-tubulin suppressor-like RCC1 family protein